MTPEEITKLAEEYAVEVTKDMAKTLDESSCLLNETKRATKEYITVFMQWLLRVHCIVEKSNVEEAEEVTIDGWVAIDEAYNDCFLHTSKPHQESQAIADTGDYDTVWESDGKTYLLDKGFFPAMDSESDPLEVTITIKPKKQ